MPGTNMTPLRLPRGVKARAAVAQTLTLDVHSKRTRPRRVLGKAEVQLSAKGRIVNVSIDSRLVRLGLLAGVLTTPENSQTLTDCIDADKCADKPTSAGVALCVANCVLKVLEDAAAEVLNA